MTKIASSLLLLAGALLAGPASAASYVEFAGGRSSGDVDCTGTVTCDKTSTFVRATGGWMFGDTWSVEGTLGQLGTLRASADVPGVGLVDAKVRVQVLGIGGAARVPLSNALDLTGRAGLYSVRSKLTGNAGGLSASDSETKTEPYIGIGLGWAVTPHSRLGLALERTRAGFDGEKTDVTLIGLSWRVAF